MKSGQPFSEPMAGGGHVFGRAGKRKTDPAAATDRVEIEPRRDRHSGFSQEPPAETSAVPRQAASSSVRQSKAGIAASCDKAGGEM